MPAGEEDVDDSAGVPAVDRLLEDAATACSQRTKLDRGPDVAAALAPLEDEPAGAVA